MIKNLNTAHEMWEKVKADTTMKSMPYLIDTDDQLASMQLMDLDDPRTHLIELKQHFELMGKQCDNLLKMGSTISATHYHDLVFFHLFYLFFLPFLPFPPLF